MSQTALNLHEASAIFNPVHAAALALRGAEHLYDLNVSTARLLIQAQFNTAAAFGMPDWLPLFDLATDQTRSMMLAGAEQVLDAGQHTNDVSAELQRQAGRILKTQVSELTDPGMPMNPVSQATRLMM